MPRVAQSRARLIAEIGQSPDVTFIRTTGNVGDQLIWAGTRELLRDHVYREIAAADVAFAGGELALISGGGAWTRRYVSQMPEILAIAELRFDRVIVLPSSFEVAEDRVREALCASNAKFFAREFETYRQISGICDAELAHDCAFFADLSKYARIKGDGELNAFRCDDEASGLVDLPADNNDISATADSLDAWLTEIAEHQTVNTDRAHVMIAGALLGKRVKYMPCDYFKVDSIAESCLTDLDVSRHPDWRARPDVSVSTPSTGESARVELVVLNRDSAQRTVDSVEAVRTSGLTNVCVHDRNSRPAAREMLAELAGRRPDLSVRFADRDGGVASVMRLLTEESDAEYLLVIEAGTELAEGSLEAMVAALDEAPDAVAVAPLVVDASGSVQHCGGWLARGGQTLELKMERRDQRRESVPGGTAPTGWVPLTGSLLRRSVFDRTPLAAIDDLHVQGVEWSLRVEQGGGLLLACRDAVIESDWHAEAATAKTFSGRHEAALRLPALSELHDRSGLLLSDRLALLVPELQTESGEIDLEAARLLLGIVAERGPAWVLMEWTNGGLAPLIGLADDHPAIVDAAAEAAQRREYVSWLEQRNEMLTGIESGGWWKLRERVQPVLRFTRRGGSK